MQKWIRTSVERLFFYTPHISQAKLTETFENKTILLTGATFGIGEACVRKLAQLPCQLILVARTEEKLISLKNELESSHCKIHYIVADLYDISSSELIYQQVQQLQLKIDCLIHNAGKSIQRSIWKSIDRPQDIDRTIHINYLNPAHLTRLFLNDLKTTSNQQHQSQILVVSTINAKLFAPPLWANYQASKSAFAEWIKAIQPELKIHNINAALIYLPLVRTRMILPTTQYASMPAMLPTQAADAILACAAHNKCQWQPWWLSIAQLCCIVFATPIQFFYRNLLKRNM